MQRPWPTITLLSLITLSSACDNQSHQRSFKAGEPGGVRHAPDGTVRMDEADESLDGRGFPRGMVLDHAALVEGKKLFERTCSACHGMDGSGQGIAPARGLSPPSSFYQVDLLEAGPETFHQMMTWGTGKMPSYARRVTSSER